MFYFINLIFFVIIHQMFFFEDFAPDNILTKKAAIRAMLRDRP